MADENGTLAAITEEIQKKTRELSDIEELAKRAPALRADIAALERTKIILQNGSIGSTVEKKAVVETEKNLFPNLHFDPVLHHSPIGFDWKRKSVEEQVVDVFREYGDLSAEKLHKYMQDLGSSASRHTIMGTIYRSLKQKGEKSPFRKLAAGVFGLKENALSA